MMDRSLIYFLLLSLQLALVQSLECNASHMNFVSQYSLGKQDEFNRTFTLLQQNMPTIASVSYKAPNGYLYSISNIKVNYYYRDSKQTSTARGDDVVLIEGGQTEVDITFNWRKNSSFSPINGNGSASGLSQSLTLAKQLIIDNNMYSYAFLDAFPFLMPENDAFNLTRLEPANTVPSDISYIMHMLNAATDKKDVRGHLEQAVAGVFNEYINASLHDEHFPLNLTFQYKWIPKTQKPTATIPFVRRPTTVDVQKIGLISTFDIQTENSTVWTCGTRKVIELPLDPSIFGGIQEFISFDFYQNVLKEALHRGILNSDLNEEAWGNRMFHFHAGDLYEVLSGISDKYSASEKVIGECIGDSSGLSVAKNSQNTFNVTLKYGCHLDIKNEKVVTFQINLVVVVAGRPKRASLDFEVVSHSQTASIHPEGQYQLQNKGLAEAMISDSLNRLSEGDLFGCGWPQSPPRDYPVFRVEDNYTIVVDQAMRAPILTKYIDQ